MKHSTFRSFLVEQDQDQQQQQAQLVAAKVRELFSQQSLTALVRKFKARTIDDLIAALKRSPEVQNKIRAWQQVQNRKVEGNLDEGVWSVLKGVWDNTLGPVVNWLRRSVTKTLGHIFGAFGSDGAFSEKALYAMMLIAMVGVPIKMLTMGVGIAAAGSALGVGAGTFFGLMWFGKNFIEPLMKMAEPGMAPA